jgi:hypothetical protein
VSPVRYELGFDILEDVILQGVFPLLEQFLVFQGD